MGLFTTKARELYDWLIHQPLTAQLQASSPADVAAGLAALAKVESNYDQSAKGDFVNGEAHAWGYWQVNDRVWKVDTGRVLGDRAYQLELAAAVWRQAESAVAAALKTIGKHRADREEVTFSPAKDLPTFYNIAWQYGAGGLSEFVANWDNLTATGFADYRDFVGKPVYGGRVAFLARCVSFTSEYQGWTADPPDFWQEVVAKTASDAAALPGQAAAGALDAAKTAATKVASAATAPVQASILDQIRNLETKAIHVVLLVVAAFVLAIATLAGLVYFVKRKPA